MSKQASHLIMIISLPVVPEEGIIFFRLLLDGAGNTIVFN
jgi:hypothetical protein